MTRKLPTGHALDHLIVRKEHVLCTRCGKVEPIHPGDGTPASSFVLALRYCALQHGKCGLPKKG